MRKIVFDIETVNFPENGSFDPKDLDLSLIAIYDSETDSYMSFLKDELSELWPLIEKADMLIGYNSDHFDIPLLNKYYPGDLTRIKSLDLMKEIRSALGRRLKLDSVAKATLGRGKTGDGFQAIEWWQKGEIDKVRQYCIDDVRLTKELYDYALQKGHIKYRDYGGIREVPLNTAEWEKRTRSALTHTLPF